MSDCSEDSLIEHPTIELFSGLGWKTATCCCQSSSQVKWTREKLKPGRRIAEEHE